MEQVHKFDDATPLPMPGSVSPSRHAKLFNILQDQAPEDSGELRDIRKAGVSLSDHEILSVQQHAIDSFTRRAALTDVA